MLPSTVPSYTEVTEALSSTGSAFQAPDAHGLLCGFICATAGKSDGWEKLIVGTTLNVHGIEVLRQLYESSYHQMSEFSFEFSLLLPADDEDINVRTEGLGLWCTGFLTGLGDTVRTLENSAASEVVDALNDLTEIAQVSFGDIGATDEEETAYYELEEYVRLIVLMIYHDLNLSPESIDGDDEDEMR